MSVHRIGALAGSRREGWSSRLLAALPGLAPSGLRLERLPLELPLYHAEHDDLVGGGGGAPVEVIDLRNRVGDLDGLLVVTPEYNHSVPGVLKNTIDWLSRPAFHSPLRDLPVGMVTFGPGPAGGVRGQQHLKQVLLGTSSAVFPWPEVALGRIASRFDGERGLVDDDARSRLSAYLEGFDRWVEAVGHYRTAGADSSSPARN